MDVVWSGGEDDRPLHAGGPVGQHGTAADGGEWAGLRGGAGGGVGALGAGDSRGARGPSGAESERRRGDGAVGRREVVGGEDAGGGGGAAERGARGAGSRT